MPPAGIKHILINNTDPSSNIIPHNLYFPTLPLRPSQTDFLVCSFVHLHPKLVASSVLTHMRTSPTTEPPGMASALHNVQNSSKAMFACYFLGGAFSFVSLLVGLSPHYPLHRLLLTLFLRLGLHSLLTQFHSHLRLRLHQRFIRHRRCHHVDTPLCQILGMAGRDPRSNDPWSPRR